MESTCITNKFMTSKSKLKSLTLKIMNVLQKVVHSRENSIFVLEQSRKKIPVKIPVRKNSRVKTFKNRVKSICVQESKLCHFFITALHLKHDKLLNYMRVLQK